MLRSLSYRQGLTCSLVGLTVFVVVSTWKYLYLLILLAGGATPYTQAMFTRACSHDHHFDVGIETIKLLNECGLPDKAVTLVCAKMNHGEADRKALYIEDICFYLRTIDKSGSISPQRWLELTRYPQQFFDDNLAIQESSNFSRKNQAGSGELIRHHLGFNIIDGLENHHLNADCLEYFHRILALDAKFDGRDSTSYRSTLAHFTNFCARHKELPNGREDAIGLLKNAIDRDNLTLRRIGESGHSYYQLTKFGNPTRCPWAEISPDHAFD